MNTEDKDIDQTKRLFICDTDAAVLLGGPIRQQEDKAIGVLTDSLTLLWRLDWILEECARRGVDRPQLLPNRNTGRINRIRANGRTFKVRPCKTVLLGDEFLL